MQCNVALPIAASDEEYSKGSSNRQTETYTGISSHFSKGSIHHVLLATAVVKVESRNNHQLLRALIDQGSQASFITESAVQLLGLKKTATKGIISGLGGEGNLITKSKVMVNIHSRLNPGCITQVEAYVLDKLTSYLPATKMEIVSWPGLDQIELADPNYHTPSKIDILLGAEVYGQIIREGLIKNGNYAAQQTTHGWILTGTSNQKDTREPCQSIFSLHAEVVGSIDDTMRSFWEMEEDCSTTMKILTEEEEKCEQIFKDTTERDEEGRYIVSLPFRDNNPRSLEGDSRCIALRRFYCLEKRLQKNPHLKEEFKKVFDEYLQLNHMERVPAQEESSTQALYLPYHAVVRADRETTKVRVVFDASCKGTNGVSLNDDLMVGPKLQSDLRHIVMRWRTHPICFVADIVKMYRQIKVAKADTEFQRVLWREDPNQPIREYRLLRVTFGISSAPYLAVKSLIQLAIDEGVNFEAAAEIVKRDFYVDDLMSGCQTEEQAVKIQKQMSELMKKGGFELQKWTSNSESVLEQIQGENIAKNDEKKLEVKLDPVNKVMGLTSNRKSDEMMYAVQLPPATAPVTKRKVISDISRLYDPLGWIAPSIVSAKIFIQKLWLAGLEWDQELTPQLLRDWLTYREDLSQLINVRLPRWLGCSRDDDRLVELHGFSDASNVAYGAVVYLRVIDSEGNIHVRLITAKTKVAPIKQISIPRLELCGAVLLTKLIMEVSEVLEIPKGNLHAWTDSELVLAWLSCHPSKWKTYIGNRVSEIVTQLNRNQWSHVQSEHNPADCASRGVKPSDMAEHDLWLNGPSWLKQEVIIYPNSGELVTNLEERVIKAHAATVDEDEDAQWWKYSSLNKLVRVVAYCRRMLKKKTEIKSYLEVEEISEALKIIIRKCQRTEFGEEMKNINQGKEANKKSKLTSYNPYLDQFGILQIGGRVQPAPIEKNRKRPILIPHYSPLVKVL